MTERIHNFSAGPAVLPVPVLEEAQRDMLSLPGVGMSVMEISHRSKTFTRFSYEPNRVETTAWHSEATTCYSSRAAPCCILDDPHELSAQKAALITLSPAVGKRP